MLSSAVVETCHEAIVEAVAFADKDRVSASDSPEPKSIAWREFYVTALIEEGPSGKWTTETARSAHAVGALAVMPATQTLFALSQLVRPGQQMAAFGFEIMARAVLEASARTLRDGRACCSTSPYLEIAIGDVENQSVTRLSQR